MSYDMISLRKAFAAEDYVFDEEFLVTVYLSLMLKKPLLVEGAAGVGKTETAKVLANIFGSDLIRLQCYEGLDETKALYEWNYQKQLLDIQLRKDTCDNMNIGHLFERDYLMERPLLKAISSAKQSVLLIDEVDKTDEAFEAFLLELLSDFQVSIPELGTIKATSIPIVILTSNATRELSDALKRRCIYMYIDYPSIEKEMQILKNKVKGIDTKLSIEIASAANYLRNNNIIQKKPSISETIDWASALIALKAPRLDEELLKKTSGIIFKNKDDAHFFSRVEEAENIITSARQQSSAMSKPIETNKDSNCSCQGKHNHD